MKKLVIYFDMDGTIADLYGSQNWLQTIQEEKSGAYEFLNPMFEIQEFNNICTQLIKNGVHFGVISWGSKNSSDKFLQTVRNEKIKWLRKYLPFIEDINVVHYGIPKQTAIKTIGEYILLIDDNQEVINTWENGKERKGVHITPQYTVTNALYDILKNLEA